LESLKTQILPLSLTYAGKSFALLVGEEVTHQTICEFMLTFSSMVGTNIEDYLADLANECDTIRVPLSGNGKSVILPLLDFARLRTLYGQMMFELKLQDLLVRNSIFPQATFELATLN
jgi:hypothetical protein